MFAPMQDAYEREAEEMDWLKILTMGCCEQRAYENGHTNYSVCWNCAQRREWKFAQIRGYIYTGTIFAPMQGAY